MLIRPDDTFGQNMGVSLAPNAQPEEPGDLVRRAASEQDLSLPRMDPSQVQQPEFNARKSKVFKVLAGAGALATLLTPETGIGAAGAGLAQGAAENQLDLVDTFLSAQDEAREMSQAIQQFNAQQATTEQTEQYRTQSQRSLEELRQEGRAERDEAEHERTLTEIAAREAANLQTRREFEEWVRTQPLTEKEKEDVRIDWFRAKTGRQREERLGNQQAPESLPDGVIDEEMQELEVMLREGKEVSDGLGGTQRVSLSPTETIRVRERLNELRRMRGPAEQSAIPMEARAAGFTPEEWNALTPEERQQAMGLLGQ